MRVGEEGENHAMEIRLLAARRIGELVPAEKSGPGRGKKSVRTADGFPDRQRLSEFRKLADMQEGDCGLRDCLIVQLLYYAMVEK